MASTPTTSNRLNKQGPGDNVGTWGEPLNEQVIERIDESLDGITVLTVNAPVTLTSVNYLEDQARNRIIKCAGFGSTITIPGVSKHYIVHNGCTGNVTIKTAAGAGALVPPGAITGVYCDGLNTFVMTSLFPVANGTVTGPSIRFASDPNTGFYRIAEDRIGLTCGGVRILDVSMAGLTVAGQVVGTAGHFTSAGYNFSGWTARLKITYGGGASEFGIALRPQVDNTNSLIMENAAGGTIGAIVQSATATTYNTSSDYRLKTGIATISADASGAFIDGLIPRQWTWISDNQPGAGFIAHEAQAITPTSVNGVMDDIDGQGKPVYQTMQASSTEMMANVVRELQAGRARLAELEARVAALEAA